MAPKLTCVAEGCTNKPCKDLEFFDFPTDVHQKACWLVALKKPKGWEPPENTKVCSVHFVNREYLNSSVLASKMLM